MTNKKEMHNLGVKLGIIFGVTLLSLVLLNMTLGLGEPIIVLLASLYKGYAVTFAGAIMGLILGFIHGYIVGALVVFLKGFIHIKL